VEKPRPKYFILGRAHGRDRVTLWFNNRETAVMTAKVVATLPGQSPVALIEACNAKDAVTFYFANGEEV
jgi:hypothetical protein